jgi:calcineurin-like phosphoesterase family protein
LRDPSIAFDEYKAIDLIDYGNIDVLLTHQGPIDGAKGNAFVAEIADLIKPQLHLHGHTHKFYDVVNNGVRTISLS